MRVLLPFDVDCTVRTTGGSVVGIDFFFFGDSVVCCLHVSNSEAGGHTCLFNVMLFSEIRSKFAFVKFQ